MCVTPRRTVRASVSPDHDSFLVVNGLECLRDGRVLPVVRGLLLDLESDFEHVQRSHAKARDHTRNTAREHLVTEVDYTHNDRTTERRRGREGGDETR